MRTRVPASPLHVERSARWSIQYGRPYCYERGALAVQDKRIQAIELLATTITGDIASLQVAPIMPSSSSSSSPGAWMQVGSHDDLRFLEILPLYFEELHQIRRREILSIAFVGRASIRFLFRLQTIRLTRWWRSAETRRGVSSEYLVTNHRWAAVSEPSRVLPQSMATGETCLRH